MFCHDFELINVDYLYINDYMMILVGECSDLYVIKNHLFIQFGFPLHFVQRTLDYKQVFKAIPSTNSLKTLNSHQIVIMGIVNV